MKLTTDCFPLPQPRPGQWEVVERVAAAFADGARFVILEGPTGSGKSAIGMALANAASSAYYLTVTRQLQDQLEADFPAAPSLKGRASYPCTFYDLHGQRLLDRQLLTRTQLDRRRGSSCDDGWCKVSSGGLRSKCNECFPVDGVVDGGTLRELPDGLRWSTCPYYERAYAAADAKTAVLNYHSFLFQTGQQSSKFGRRELLILDEAHAAEPTVLGHVATTLHEAALAGSDLKLPRGTPQDFVAWFRSADVTAALTQLVEDARDAGDRDRVNELRDLCVGLRRAAAACAAAPDDWLVERQRGRLTLRPTFGRRLFEGLFFGQADHVLLMSGTILDHDLFAASLGLDEWTSIKLPCTFPVANRPIYVLPAVRATGGVEGLKRWGPDMAEAVDAIVADHAGLRGIVHTHNFRIAELLLERCATAGRFLFQRNFADKTAMLAEHAGRPDSVIVAPGMHEGVDLHGELSRFQILCKVPYPIFHEDKQLARRMELQPGYYEWLTVLKLIQATGRSVRSEADWARTFIIDSAFQDVLRRDGALLPDWFKEALIF